MNNGLSEQLGFICPETVRSYVRCCLRPSYYIPVLISFVQSIQKTVILQGLYALHINLSTEFSCYTGGPLYVAIH
jgi:hypothetical protein